VAAEAEEGEDEGPPPPERVWLETKDGWKIHATYYAPQEGKRDGKQTVPVIMIHGWEGQGSEYSILAMGLQKLGHASIVPDLRGHGRSTTRRLPDGDFKTLKHGDRKFATEGHKDNMILDVEAAKNFLIEKNNAGEVNIEMLCVVGAEMGSIVALNWAAMDWSAPRTPYLKQGQYVKALVLLSPRQAIQRLTATKALAHPAIARQVSIMIAVGKEGRKEYSDAKRIHSRLENIRPHVEPEDRLRKQDLFLITADTNLQGTNLLNRNLPVNIMIARFIDLRLLFKREDYPWGERKSPLAGR
jgi:alpha-beta hydrolase superfamily lysophospholipase